MAGGFRFLSLVAPFMSVLPEVSPPDRKIPFRCDAPSLQRAAPLAAACSGRASWTGSRPGASWGWVAGGRSPSATGPKARAARAANRMLHG
jgi:hypothetical protein